jgi:hypothetical protein
MAKNNFDATVSNAHDITAVPANAAISLRKVTWPRVLKLERAQGWDLILEAEQRLICSLLADGALAAKPTGAGEGSMVLALWEHARQRPAAHAILARPCQ